MSQRFVTLIINYSALYIPIVGVLLFSEQGNFILIFSICYWAIMLPMFLLDYFGSSIKLAEDRLIGHFYFLFKVSVPLDKIISIENGYAPGILGRPASVVVKYRKGSKEVRWDMLREDYTDEALRDFLGRLATKRTDLHIPNLT